MPTPHETALLPVIGHFRRDPGYAPWRPLGTRDYLLIYTRLGSGRFSARDGQSKRTAAGDVVLLRPHTYQEYATEPGEAWDLIWAHFVPRAEWLDLLDWPSPWDGVGWLSNVDTLDPLLSQLHRAAQTADPLRDRLVWHALEGVLLACEQANPNRRHPATDQRLRAVLEYIGGHLDRPIGVEDLAAVAGLSASRLAHLFRARVGASVMQYLETRRLERATDLLCRTSMSVKEIARQVGFASPFYFSVRFKSAMRQSPSAYRLSRS